MKIIISFLLSLSLSLSLSLIHSLYFLHLHCILFFLSQFSVTVLSPSPLIQSDICSREPRHNLCLFHMGNLRASHVFPFLIHVPTPTNPESITKYFKCSSFFAGTNALKKTKKKTTKYKTNKAKHFTMGQTGSSLSFLADAGNLCFTNSDTRTIPSKNQY